MYDEDGFEVGEDVMGEDDFSVIGIARGRGKRGKAIRRVIPVPGGGVVAVQRPGWRNGQVAPGVQAPAQGLVPITFQPQEAQQFSATVSFLTFTAKTQVPFRGERLLVEVLRTGVSATGRLIGQMFMGIGLQQANIQGFDIEKYKLAASQVKLQARIKLLIRIIRLLLDDPKFNPDSPKQIVKYFHEKLMYKVVERTDSGAPSLGGKAMYTLALKYPNPLIQLILYYREIQKEMVMSTFHEFEFPWRMQ